MIAIPSGDTAGFEELITTGIKPDIQKKFISNTRIDLFRDSQRIGYIMIQNGKTPAANFNSQNLNFGFRLTYRLGMWISEMSDSERR